MKIYFINSKKENCGVYQYGLRIWDALKYSNLDISYYEIENADQFRSLDFSNVDILFFNWIEGGYTGPFGWYMLPLALEIKQKYGVVTATVMHTKDFSTTSFDYYFDQNTRDSGFIRPLYNYDITKPKPKNSIPTIGSFGFAGDHKGFDDIVRKVNKEYDEAVINLHITNAYYGDADGSGQHRIINEIKSIPLKPGIKLNITTAFLTNEEILDFVYKNDIIILAYKYVGDISGVPDYAISANTPIAVTSVGAFKHVYKPEIDINLHTISEILRYNLSTEYVKSLREEWSRENLVDSFSKLMSMIMEEINNKSYSQVCQDRFALTLIGKNGYFLDLGAGWDHSGLNSNTLLLEENGWNGICVDANPNSASRRREAAIGASVVTTMIPQTSIKSLLDSHSAPKVIDYISVDIDPNSVVALENFPFDEYEFKVMTFEHDAYAAGTRQKDLAYEILSNKGYYRLCDNVNVPESQGLGLYFEDWWINPKYFSEDFINKNTFEKALGPDIIKNIKK